MGTLISIHDPTDYLYPWWSILRINLELYGNKSHSFNWSCPLVLHRRWTVWWSALRCGDCSSHSELLRLSTNWLGVTSREVHHFKFIYNHHFVEVFLKFPTRKRARKNKLSLCFYVRGHDHGYLDVKCQDQLPLWLVRFWGFSSNIFWIGKCIHQLRSSLTLDIPI